MGRLSVVRATCLCAAAIVLPATACDKEGAGAPIKRRDAVITSAKTPNQTTAPSVAPKKHAPKPQALCTEPSLNKEFPSQQVGHGEAPGAEALGTRMRVGHGRWVWINLWAAWCGPCKEELPRLLSWQKKLADSTDFYFLSLDDDQRQFQRFLVGQPPNGLRSSYWLPEGKTRAKWLKDLGIESSPELPIQLLVNPKGRLHCIIKGVVEDIDLPRVRQITSRP